MPFSILVFQAFSVCTSSRQWIQQHVPNTSLSLCSMSPQVSPGLPSFIFSGFGPFGPCQDLLHEGQSVVKRLLFCPANIWQPSATSANSKECFWNPLGSRGLKNIWLKNTIPIHSLRCRTKHFTVAFCKFRSLQYFMIFQVLSMWHVSHRVPLALSIVTRHVSCQDMTEVNTGRRQ